MNRPLVARLYIVAISVIWAAALFVFGRRVTDGAWIGAAIPVWMVTAVAPRMRRIGTEMITTNGGTFCLSFVALLFYTSLIWLLTHIPPVLWLRITISCLAGASGGLMVWWSSQDFMKVTALSSEGQQNPKQRTSARSKGSG